MKPIKLGIIGCGIAARELHWPALRKLKDMFEITVVCNHTEPKARDFSKMLGNVPYVLDYRELIKRPDVEAVDITLPIHLHYQVTKDALQAGKHVIVEKPLAANLSEARSMVQFESQYPQVKMVAENFRYRSYFRRLKEYMDQGRIGKPYAMFWNIFALIDSDNIYAQTKWRMYHQYPGGFITDAGIHYIAALRYMFGDIVSGNAFTKSINPDIGRVDSMSFQFTTTSNVSGVWNIFMSANGFSEDGILIYGTQGSVLAVQIGETFGNTKITIQKNGITELKEIIENDTGFQEEFKDFYQAVRTGQKVISSFSEAYRDLQVVIKALDSANRWHDFGLDS